MAELEEAMAWHRATGLAMEQRDVRSIPTIAALDFKGGAERTSRR
jgi:hypothetical protein